ncbi:putative lipase [Xylariaceae sp. FL1019]|nr:putative lipase [Xylariaceae sp. FL1019]
MMKSTSVLSAALLLFRGASAKCYNTSIHPSVVDDVQGVTYKGLNRNGIEVFLGIPYGEDTGGANRFKRPTAYTPERGSVITAQSYGPSCPQPTYASDPPFFYSNVTEISEDCLNLVLGRPKGTTKDSHLPVMVYIHGGSFFTGANVEVTEQPDGLVKESIQNGLPVIEVGINYRLGAFGFANSDALQAEGSTNAGLRDQRLAIEWVHDHIDQFGGDPEKITIFGQSSGGLAIGMQIMAYGGSKPVPFSQGICESQALEPGITGNFTRDAMQALVDYLGCNKTELNSAETIECLRSFDTVTLFNASSETHISDFAHNIGDTWLPAVDGDFLPAAPSELIKQGRFANVTTMVLWCDGDLNVFLDTSIQTNQDTYDLIQDYQPAMTSANVDKLLSLYDVSEFPADEAAGLSSEFYRAARIVRDILMTCQPMHYAEAIASRGNAVYLVDWNQTISDQVIKALWNETGFGVIHTSDLEYVFGNISALDPGGIPFHVSAADHALVSRGSRSWSTFATTGSPSLDDHDTFVGFTPAFPGNDQVNVFVAGGPSEGLSPIDGPGANPALEVQKIRERCAFINSEEIIKQLQY